MPTKPKKLLYHSNLGMPMSTTYIFNRFLLDSVAAGQSNVFELDLACHKGELFAVKIQCLSANFDAYVYAFPVVEKDSMMVLYSHLAANKLILDQGLTLPWSKYSSLDVQSSPNLVDPDMNLYLEIVNKDVQETGDIYAEIVFVQGY